MKHSTWKSGTPIYFNVIRYHGGCGVCFVWNVPIWTCIKKVGLVGQIFKPASLLYTNYFFILITEDIFILRLKAPGRAWQDSCMHALETSTIICIMMALAAHDYKQTEGSCSESALTHGDGAGSWCAEMIDYKSRKNQDTDNKKTKASVRANSNWQK